MISLELLIQCNEHLEDIGSGYRLMTDGERLELLMWHDRIFDEERRDKDGCQKDKSLYETEFEERDLPLNNIKTLEDFKQLLIQWEAEDLLIDDDDDED